MKIKEHIPNFLTLLNLLSGCIAVVFAFEDIIISSYLVGVAAIFDFLDGFTARLLKAKSSIGKDLDSLADMVSFGVVPGVILFRLIESSVMNENYDNYFLNFAPFIAFAVTLFSALRLAKFNNDERQTDIFLGLPTPANAILIASFPLILIQKTIPAGCNISTFQALFHNAAFLIATTIILSWLLISEIPMISLKFKNRLLFLTIINCLLLI